MSTWSYVAVIFLPWQIENHNFNNILTRSTKILWLLQKKLYSLRTKLLWNKVSWKSLLSSKFKVQKRSSSTLFVCMQFQMCILHFSWCILIDFNYLFDFALETIMAQRINEQLVCSNEFTEWLRIFQFKTVELSELIEGKQKIIFSQYNISNFINF